MVFNLFPQSVLEFHSESVLKAWNLPTKPKQGGSDTRTMYDVVVRDAIEHPTPV